MTSVSVILPTYNRADFLKRSVESVLAQTYPHFELFIVNDGSSDCTEQTLSPYFQDSRVSYIFTKNKGVSHARNFALPHTRGEWVAFLDSDDEWLPEKLKTQVQHIEAHPNHQIIHCNELWRRNGQPLSQLKKHQKFGGRIFDKCVPLCVISPSAVMIHKSCFNNTPAFREDFEVCEDYELWLRLTSRYEVGFIDQPLLIKHGGHSDQLSTKYKAMDHWRVLALKEHLNSSWLNDRERQLVRDTFEKKCHILIKGYKKHGHVKKAQDIEDLLQQHQT